MTTQIGDRNSARSIVGYCWPWTVRPGESLDFMVSTESCGEKYRADLVRIICAEGIADPKMFKEQELESPFAGLYEGRYQETHLGSYVEIGPSPALNRLDHFTVQAMVMPMLLPAGVRQRLGGAPVSVEEPIFQDQHLVSRWDNQGERGWALIIDANGHPAFICGDGESIHRTTLSRALIQDRWFFVAAAVDAKSRTVSLHVRHISRLMSSNVAWPETRIEARHGPDLEIFHEGPLRFGACTDGPGNASRLKPGLCFSGRLDRVRLSAGALNDSQAFTLAGNTIPASPTAPIVGFWDFGKGIDSVDVHDLSANQLDGLTVNMPVRAVTGVSWDSSVTDWRQRPDHYSAIHFHDDDLYDAEWESDFSYTVPDSLPSGIYAARLRHGEFEDHIPFFVAPSRGKAVAPTALLIPTATYTAYTNVTAFTTGTRKRQVRNDLGETKLVDEDLFPAILQDSADADFLLKNLRRLGKGIYANHTDGTLFGVASQRHPNMTARPNSIQWTLAADSLITDWLEEKNIPCDIITDELLHREGLGLLCNYQVIITGNHPEYYSKSMLDAVEAYQERGGRFIYAGGNGFLWVTSFSEALPGAVESRKNPDYSGHWKPYEIRHAFDGALGGFWEQNGRPPQLLVGVGFSEATGYSFAGSAPYRRMADSHDARATFIFEGVSNETFGGFGIFGGGACGQEFDRISPELGTPAHALHIARADDFPSYVSMLAAEYADNVVKPFGDVIFFETPKGGAVFATGSMAWVGALSHNGYDNDISRITENVLRRFLDKTPFFAGHCGKLSSMQPEPDATDVKVK